MTVLASRVPLWLLQWIVNSCGTAVHAAETELSRREEVAWMESMRRRFPIGSRVACRCHRCNGKTWWVHGYDDEAHDVRVFRCDVTQVTTLLATRWPLPHDVESTWCHPDGLSREGCG
jgi:hypothetical protein